MVNNDKKEYTIKDVAILAGVSTATAGRVLGGYGSVSSKTARSVMEAAQKLNYIPNAIAQSMKKRNTNTVGLIVANICNPYFSTIAKATEEHLAKHGYHVIICNTDEDLDKEISYIKTLYEKRIDGLMIATAFKGNEKISEEIGRMYDGKIPTLIIDREIAGLSLPTVTSDNFRGAYDATSHLIRLGHKRIGVIGTTISTLYQRVDGYKKALTDNGIPLDQDLIANKGVPNLQAGDVREGKEIAIHMLTSSKTKVTAILALNNLLTFGALQAIRELGLKIPDDVAFIGWDDFELATVMNPPITVVNQSTGDIAAIASSRLLQMMDEPAQDEADRNRKVVLATQLIVRGSCGS
ncbi:hypothetical protein B1A99_21720 [Cohnella sp. CIP 111063]|jgi:DNA-binding LacI/PurR family transcriptional regulator|uniref:LacI family DNA-binding transcriptional regulator n=1 Tax=unclassified Cohnella TaxID=2636738 RepID=UPI000B8C126C|nr:MULTISPECIES: LacI family DNA-binding transcriptional regulator [unclassified Cohnella]OXS55848.1 hypothetical protein B1A99_21720 [Cohnella sp. CIP 111063]PRX67047.1 LacI family transcriptional regulator [Cohnella sp. SGD-V74]